MVTRAVHASVEVEMPPSVLQRAAAFGLKLASSLAFVAPLLTRITVGYAFFLTGRGKLANLDQFAGFLSELGVPFATAQAPFIAGLEFVGGICLVLGLLTRVMGIGLAATMLVALLTADRQTFLSSWLPTGEVGPLDVPPWVFLLLLSWLVLYGPGRLSLDTLLAKRLGLGEERQPQ
jgi:putative oxidoreductase